MADRSCRQHRYRRRANRLLYAIAVVLVAAVFTRYDGWVMAFLAWMAIGLTLARRGRLGSRAFWMASVIVVAAPVVWFSYNAVVFGDWLDFRARTVFGQGDRMRTATPGSGPPHPGWHNPWVSLKFFVKAAEMDAAGARWGNWLLGASMLGTAWAWLIARRRAFLWSLLLWLPVPFYAYSVAYGSVPIFSAALVAALLVQHALWAGTVCRHSRWGWDSLRNFM